jgi:hypothetical protein
MLRALTVKEWRQLRTLLWGALALTLILPAGLATVVALAASGVAFEAFAEVTSRDLWAQALPLALAFGVWPMMLGVAIAHLWCVENQEGTAMFVAARPVPAYREAAAKGLAWMAMAAVIVAFGSAVGVFLAYRVASLSDAASLYMTAVGRSTLVLAILVPAIWCACALVRRTLPATLLGVVLTVSVVSPGILLGLWFPLATFPLGGKELPVAYGVGVLWSPGFALAAWHGLGRGEWLGRGRRARAIRMLVAVAIVVGIAFFVGANAAVRWADPVDQLGSSRSNTTGRVWVRSKLHHVDLVDDATGRVRWSFPYLKGMTWNSERSLLAVELGVSRFGSHHGSRLFFVRANGDRVGHPIQLSPGQLGPTRFVWSGDLLVALQTSAVGVRSVSRGIPSFVLTIVDPAAASARRVNLPPGTGLLLLADPSVQGEVVVVNHRTEGPDDVPSRVTTEHWRLDLDRGELVRAPEFDAVGTLAVNEGFSPSGRYVRGSGSGDEPGVGLVLDRETKRTLAVPRPIHAVWLYDDSLVWIEKREDVWTLQRVSPGGTPESVASWRGGSGGIVGPAPGRRAVVITAEDPFVWDAMTGAVSILPKNPDSLWRMLEWVGPETLAWRGPDYLVLADLDSLDKRRVVFGKDPFLKGAPAN